MKDPEEKDLQQDQNGAKTGTDDKHAGNIPDTNWAENQQSSIFMDSWTNKYMISATSARQERRRGPVLH